MKPASWVIFLFAPIRVIRGQTLFAPNIETSRRSKTTCAPDKVPGVCPRITRMKPASFGIFLFALIRAIRGQTLFAPNIETVNRDVATLQDHVSAR